jgi:hypothetical protein
MVMVQRAAVIEAESAINAMIERVRSPKPVQAQGMALAERILTNADGSPLYNVSEPGTLRREMRGAASALDTHDAQSDQLPIAA